MACTSGSSAGSGDDGALPLEQIEGLTAEQIELLKGLWITTVEGFVSRCATKAGRDGMGKLLGCTAEELDRLHAAARSLLPEDVLKELEKPRDLPPMGLLMGEPEEPGE